MTDWTTNLPTFDAEALPVVFSEPNRTTMGLNSEQTLRRQAARRASRDCRKLTAAREVLTELPNPSETLHLLHCGHFDGSDLLQIALELIQPATCPVLTIASLGVNERTLAMLTEALDSGRVGALTLLLSHYFSCVDRSIYDRTHAELTRRGGQVAIARCHAKLWIVPTTGTDAYVFAGSGNLRSCKSVEQLDIANDQALAEFHAGWIDALVREAQCQTPR